MPTYEFKCPECNARDELSVKVDLIEHKVLFCRTCGLEMRRVYSAPGIVFKGSGWASKS